MKKIRATTLMSLAALAAAVMAPVPAHASTITDTFYGTVVASDGFGDFTTTDLGKLFSSSTSTSLLGDAFTLTTKINNSNYGFAQPDYNINGSNDSAGLYYDSCNSGNCNPISFSLSLNSLSKKVTDSNTTDDSGSASFYGGPGGSIGIQDSQGKNSLDVELYNVLADTIGYNAVLPAMQLSNGDFANLYSIFGGANGEEVVMQVDSINAPPAAATPEPSSLLLLGTGLLGLGAVARRKLCF